LQCQSDFQRASAIGNTYRVSNDIWKGWDSIWRITNEVVPYHKWTKPGAFPDMDMLTVGLGGQTPTEERFHFSLWAILKSPLIIGASVAGTNLPADSKAILSNKEVIAINQDALGKGAQLVRRFGPEQYDIWAGELSGARKVVAITNWKNASQTVTLDLRSVGITSAKARDIWAAHDLGTLSTSHTFHLAAHELKLLVLSRIKEAAAYKSAGYYSAAAATLGGSASITTCASGQCLPTGKKVGSIGAGASVTFSNVAVKSKKAAVVVGVDFINYDIVYWVGDNTRNVSISVNGGEAKAWPFPISGGNWFETGRLTIELDGFVKGARNNVTLTNVGTGWAADLVGIEILE
jgi:alpha-galactosidase